jgi:hypothetical protein
MNNMRKTECICDVKQEQYERYFSQQSGGNMNVFTGSTRQRGYGIGSIISKGISWATPILKEGVKHVGKTLLSTGAEVVGNVADDFLSGRSVKTSARQNLKKGGQDVMREAVAYFAPKPNKKASRKRSKTTSPKAVKGKRVKKDIFS